MLRVLVPVLLASFSELERTSSPSVADSRCESGGVTLTASEAMRPLASGELRTEGGWTCAAA
jgi:hypothetical protein